MSRYVLRHSGCLTAPSSAVLADTARLVAQAGGRVVDDAPNMLLVEGSAAVARALTQLLPDWQISVETVIPLPTVPRPALRVAGARGGRRR